MIAFAVTALFATATFVAFAVIASSLRRAWSVYPELRRALAHYETLSPAVVRIKSAAPSASPVDIRPARLRPAGAAPRRVSLPAPQPAWRVAA